MGAKLISGIEEPKTVHIMRDGDIAVINPKFNTPEMSLVQYYDGTKYDSNGQHHLILLGWHSGKSWSAKTKKDLPDFSVKILKPGDQIEIT